MLTSIKIKYKWGLQHHDTRVSYTQVCENSKLYWVSTTLSQIAKSHILNLENSCSNRISSHSAQFLTGLLWLGRTRKLGNCLLNYILNYILHFSTSYFSQTLHQCNFKAWACAPTRTHTHTDTPFSLPPNCRQVKLELVLHVKVSRGYICLSWFINFFNCSFQPRFCMWNCEVGAQTHTVTITTQLCPEGDGKQGLLHENKYQGMYALLFPTYGNISYLLPVQSKEPYLCNTSLRDGGKTRCWSELVHDQPWHDSFQHELVRKIWTETLYGALCWDCLVCV